ncbi:ergothioneine biosynthesis protein EgtB [Tellurirhabdus bombi]|uniref:ergothioneine biosynthesis protein EgtB n=1 Tax=Tellurirhabdus bombi TaxID=2907205 RepID=UPI001F30F427|nr:ergothioneine biosynthesis protein EgtB [Tellurirhabdus bombi]
MITEKPELAVNSTLAESYRNVRQYSEAICHPLQIEDYVVQPIIDVSPPKWHLGHITWFWEQFILAPHKPGYQALHDDYSFVFNSYYETVGKRVLRTNRGNLTRPTVEEVYRYRQYVDEHMIAFLEHNDLSPELEALVILGLNHEQQHQELLITDIKYILGHNPLLPVFDFSLSNEPVRQDKSASKSTTLSEGVYTVGYEGNGFHFDNELGAHKVYLNEYTVSPTLVTNGEYLAFIEAGGYRNFRYWLAEGWDWVNTQQIQAPLYWHSIDGEWWQYSFNGLQPVALEEPVCHVSYYEADAFARWKGTRLPTEAEWEVAAKANCFDWGQRWEWTGSAYLPYPGFQTAEGAVGEYNGKFMVNQMVLRGASVATPKGHSRPTYRNFFQTDKRWQFTGIRTIV